MSSKFAGLSLDDMIAETEGSSWADAQAMDFSQAPDFNVEATQVGKEKLVAQEEVKVSPRPSPTPSSQYEEVKRESHMPPDELADKIPDSGPFLVFMGNLPYRASQKDIREFLDYHSLAAKQIRLVFSKNGRFSGHCYLEFTNGDAMRSALEKSGHPFDGREIKMDSASAKQAASAGMEFGEEHVDRMRGWGGGGAAGGGGGSSKSFQKSERPAPRQREQREPREQREQRPKEPESYELLSDADLQRISSERPRLQLKKRSTKAQSGTDKRGPSGKSNPFGQAKPREAVLAERGVDVTKKPEPKTEATPAEAVPKTEATPAEAVPKTEATPAEAEPKTEATPVVAKPVMKPEATPAVTKPQEERRPAAKSQPQDNWRRGAGDKGAPAPARKNRREKKAAPAAVMETKKVAVKQDKNMFDFGDSDSE